MSLLISPRKADVAQRYQHRREENPMNVARRERVRELVPSLELVQLQRQSRCEDDGAFEGRSSS